MVALIFAFAGWIVLSLIATPIIGRFLVASADETDEAQRQATEQPAIPTIGPSYLAWQRQVSDRRVHRLRQAAR